MTRWRDITSRDNPSLGQLKRMLHEPAYSRKNGWAWLEGEHLVEALVQRKPQWIQSLWVQASRRGHEPWQSWWAQVPEVVSLPDDWMKDITAMDSPPKVAAWCSPPQWTAADIQADWPTLVLDRVQDAGNAGTLLRTAAAMGYLQILAIKGTAQLWAPKVLRSAMGAHLSLRVIEGLSPQDLAALNMPLLGTSLSARSQALHLASLPWPCAWVFGHEGRGVDPALLDRCDAIYKIEQPGGEESLNVASAAAICMYESTRSRLST